VSSEIDDRLQHARAQAQQLHEKIEAAHHKSVEQMRADLSAASTKAHELSTSVRAMAEADRTGLKNKLHEAADSLKHAAETARTAADEKRGETKVHAQAALGKAREAVQKLSETIAAKRREAKAEKV